MGRELPVPEAIRNLTPQMPGSGDLVEMVNAAGAGSPVSPADAAIKIAKFESPSSARERRKTLRSDGQLSALRLGLMMALARLLSPRDFGLMAMVTVVTGFYELFTAAGLSTATIQRARVPMSSCQLCFGLTSQSELR